MDISSGKDLSQYAYENRRQLDETSYQVSSWYDACRREDTKELMSMLPLLTYDQLQRPKPTANESTPLHVACFRNYYEVVKLLLQCGCD